MRVVVNEDMKVFHGHVPVELKKGQEVSGSLAEMLLTGAPRKVSRADEADEAGESDGFDPNGKIDDILSWVGDDPDRAREALDAEQDKGDKARPRLVAKLTELTA